MRPKRRTKPPKDDGGYRLLWKLVDGAVADAFRSHPEYINHSTEEKRVRISVNKRVVGAVLSYASQRGVVGDNGG